jgi:hypothetical protein
MVALALTVPAMAMAGGGCVSGTSTAELQTTGPFAGLYKYTFTVEWDTRGSALSHLTLDLDCPSQVCNAIWRFDTPAGTSTPGEDPNGQPCTVEYVGSFNCNGDPNTPPTGPVVKWNAEGDCMPDGSSGVGTFCVYTNLPPIQRNGELWVKYSTEACNGANVGALPDCEPLPVEPATWGTIKSVFE